mgnify:CR=1 FL=1
MHACAATCAEVVFVVAHHNGVVAGGLPVLQDVVYACGVGFGGGFVAAEDDAFVKLMQQAYGL